MYIDGLRPTKYLSIQHQRTRKLRKTQISLQLGKNVSANFSENKHKNTRQDTGDKELWIISYGKFVGNEERDSEATRDRIKLGYYKVQHQSVDFQLCKQFRFNVILCMLIHKPFVVWNNINFHQYTCKQVLEYDAHY